jgi:hypothetical protein
MKDEVLQMGDGAVNQRIAERGRAAMGSGNRLKLGLFGANCSSGRAVTMVPERWSGSWPDCIRLAQMADRAGIEFMLPIGRWKGYGGRPTIRATLRRDLGLRPLAKTEGWLYSNRTRRDPAGDRRQEFVTPTISAKGVSASSSAAGTKAGQMFSATLRLHEARYAYARVARRSSSPGRRGRFRLCGRVINVKGGHAEPNPMAPPR